MLSIWMPEPSVVMSWATASRLRKVISVPCLTVVVRGVKPVELIVMVTLMGPAAGAAGGGGGAAAAGLLGGGGATSAQPAAATPSEDRQDKQTKSDHDLFIARTSGRQR